MSSKLEKFIYVKYKKLITRQPNAETLTAAVFVLFTGKILTDNPEPKPHWLSVNKVSLCNKAN